MEDLALSYYLRQAACASAPACQSPQWRLQQRPPWYPRHAGGPCLSLLYPRASSRLLVLLWEGKSILFSLLFLCSHVQLCCNVSQRNRRGNDSLTKQMSEKHLCPQDYCGRRGRSTASSNLGSIFSPCRICVITLAGSHPVLQSGKTITSISYQISSNCSRLQNKVSGKFKRVRGHNPVVIYLMSLYSQ